MPAKASKSRGARARTEPPAAVPDLALRAWTPAMAFTARYTKQLQDRFAALRWQDFAGKRLNEDFGLVRRLTAARSIDQVWHAYEDYWKTAREDYGREYTAMARLGAGLVSTSMAAIRNGWEKEARRTSAEASHSSSSVAERAPGAKTARRARKTSRLVQGPFVVHRKGKSHAQV